MPVAAAATENLYWDDVEVGYTVHSKSRTITQQDIDVFGAVTGDHHPLHSDVEFCRNTVYGRPIAHGLFGLSLMEGLKNQLKLYDLTSLGSLGWDKIRFVKPLFPGDTVHLEIVFFNKRETKKADRGIVWERIELKNQHGETLSEAEHASMLMRRGADTAPA
jgi:acyl dehydratase